MQLVVSEPSFESDSRKNDLKFIYIRTSYTSLDIATAWFYTYCDYDNVNQLQ